MSHSHSSMSSWFVGETEEHHDLECYTLALIWYIWQQQNTHTSEGCETAMLNMKVIRCFMSGLQKEIFFFFIEYVRFHRIEIQISIVLCYSCIPPVTCTRVVHPLQRYLVNY